jgi:hypothetical protein
MKKSMMFFGLSSLAATLMLGATCGSSNSPTQPKDKIAITSPSLAQKVVAGDTILVTWTQSVSSPTVSYNFNQGAGWQAFTSPSVLPVDNNSVKVILPTTSYTDSFQVKVEDNSGKYDAGISQLFTIKYIVITNPVAGQTLDTGSTVTIAWKCDHSKFSSFKIQISLDSGKTFGVMTKTSIDPSLNSYTWVVGAEDGADAPFAYPSTQCILKISDYTKSNYMDMTGIFSVQ